MAEPRWFPFKRLPLQTSKLRLGAEELGIFDSIATEVNDIVDCTADFYALNESATIRDPVYDESIQRVFDGPFKVNVWVGYPEQTPQMTPAGTVMIFNCALWVARKHIEDANAPAPKQGDVFHFWKLPVWLKEGNFDETVPNSGFAFNVLNSNPDGVMFDSPSFVGFRCTMRRVSDFTPERRIDNT